jgi:outer membrane protein TolC
VTRVSGIVCLAAIGATIASLWLSPAEAGEQPLPGATVESVVAFARRLNPTVAAAALDFDAAVHKIGTAGVLADPTLILEAWDVNRLGVGQRRFGIEQEVKLWGKYGLERDIAQADADAAKFQGRATVTELIAQVVAAHGEYNAAYEAVAISVEIKRRFDDILGLSRSRYGATSVDQRPGTEDTGEFMLGVKLPLHYEVKDAEQRAAGARLGAAQARNEALRLRIDGQIADAWFGVDALRKVVQIYESRRLPPARLSVDNARNGFQAGSSDISLVFESERRLRAVQLDLLKLKVELQAKYAEMERLAGGLP